MKYNYKWFKSLSYRLLYTTVHNQNKAHGKEPINTFIYLYMFHKYLSTHLYP